MDLGFPANVGAQLTTDPCSGASLDFVGEVRWLDGSANRLFKTSLPDYNSRAFGPSVANQR